jgi:signal transduction histidine kinase
MTVTDKSRPSPARPGWPAGTPPVPSWPLQVGERPGTGRRWSLRRWVLVVGAVVVLFATAAVGFGSLALTRLAEARSAVIDQIHPARYATENLYTAMVDQDSGVRGYSLTGREESLEPYFSGIQDAQRAVDELRLLAGSGVAGLTADLDAVLARAQDWRTTFAVPTISEIRQSGRPGSPIDPEMGKAKFDAVRVELVAMQKDLNTRQDEATARLRDAAQFLQAVFVGIGIGLAVLVVAVAAWLQFAVTVPLSRLAGEVRQVMAGDAHHKVGGRGPSEVMELAGDIDAMRRHILTEVDALEAAHQRLDEQARDLERSNRDLEQFAYVASHDLQEPLRKVSSFCQLLKRRYGGQLDERADSYIAFAVDGATRMQRLINDLLAFSRVGRLTGGLQPVDLNAVVQAAVGQLDAAREDVDAKITVGELPTVRGEASLLTQLLANLISNALKFRRAGVRPEVTIEARPDPDGWEISVSDNGIGVEPEYADKVFVIFQRLHSREAYAGTGIGLAMAKKIVEYHGGRIWLDPERTDGATVTFTLPADSSADIPADPSADPSADTEEPQP